MWWSIFRVAFFSTVVARCPLFCNAGVGACPMPACKNCPLCVIDIPAVPNQRKMRHKRLPQVSLLQTDGAMLRGAERERHDLPDARGRDTPLDVENTPAEIPTEDEEAELEAPTDLRPLEPEDEVTPLEVDEEEAALERQGLATLEEDLSAVGELVAPGGTPNLEVAEEEDFSPEDPEPLEPDEQQPEFDPGSGEDFEPGPEEPLATEGASTDGLGARGAGGLLQVSGAAGLEPGQPEGMEPTRPGPLGAGAGLGLTRGSESRLDPGSA
eukprot:CAMPEP_0204330786 /NCGR_PEP_ID=MMETSP0469-20131031/15206_1 /ASSEMBLY_ACC=CAM_ASM_000384 /TAXON_ID=2969 /ORGANISM="Oxyrrhis marina" /LENGTH=268 /DNA_ID=CAMNT_0051313657 /DNA_START=48 /DNA_END=851 /DNA_ORIENTATION=-